MLLNYDEWANFMEWVGEKEKWPYFAEILRKENLKSKIDREELIRLDIEYYLENDEQWVKISFHDNECQWQDYDFKLSTFNELYKEYQNKKVGEKWLNQY